MSFAPKNKKQTNNDKPKAIGFLNVTVKDANGNEHKLRNGIALYAENNLEQSLVNAAKAHGDDLELVVSASINVVVPVEEQEDILFK